MTDPAHRPAHRLAHVRWLGGGSGAGKSTLARALAARRGWDLVATDASLADHAGRCGPQEAPALHAFLAMTLDERWVRRSPQEMLATFPWFLGEGFDHLVADLLALPADRPVLVEGFRLLPRLVAPLLPAADRSAPGRAVWLLPTPAFRRAAFTARGGLWEIAGRTGDPPRALDNLLARDAAFTRVLREETARLGLRALDVDGTLDVDASLDRLEAAFAP